MKRMICYLLEEISNWGSYLLEKEDRIMIEDIRKHTMTRRFCGDVPVSQK